MDPHPFINHARISNTQSPASRSSAPGFTLLEIIAVIFIISLVAALVIPSFGGFGAKGIRADARRVAALLRYLNESAISMKETYPLRIDLGEASLAWKDPEGEKSERMPSLVSLDLQSQGELKEGQVTVFFSPLGLQEYLKIKLRDEDRTMTVAFNPVSGRVKIIEEGRK